MSQVDAVTRISQIQAQLAALNGGLRTAPPAGAASAVSDRPPAAPATSGVAQAADAASSTPASFANALAQAQSLPPAAARSLTPGQQQFATRLAARTGLSSPVIAAWLLAEESGGAASSRERANNHDWLNIGYTDSGTFGAGNAIWKSPATAADATAAWLRGEQSIPGYGRASAGIRAILGSAGQSPQAQVQAIQRSGWASSGYPDLPGLLHQVGD